VEGVKAHELRNGGGGWRQQEGVCRVHLEVFEGGPLAREPGGGDDDDDGDAAAAAAADHYLLEAPAAPGNTGCCLSPDRWLGV